MSTDARRPLPKSISTEQSKTESSGSSSNKSTPTQIHTPKELVKLLLSGQKNEVSKILAGLPKEDADNLRKKLLHFVDAIRKRHGSRSNKSDSQNSSKSNTPRSGIINLSGSLSKDIRSSGPRAKSAASLVPNDKKEPSSSTRGEIALMSASERANLELAGKFRIGDVLGKGGFGTVLKAVSVETGGFVAIKQIDRDLVDESQLPNVMEEAELLKRLDHPNIVKIYSIHETKLSLYFVLEYVESGSLASLIKKFGVFPEPLVAIYTQQTLRGLQYLHEKGVIHRDIKGDNILITKEGKVKLADFGTAKLEDTDKKTQTVVGTPYWMAPEVIDLTACGTASDIWSVGCTVIELLTGSPPYFDMGPMTALFNIVEDEHPPLPDALSDELKDFLLSCFKRDPNIRPSAKAMQEHPFLKKYIKEQQISMDLEQVTGTIRMHNQADTKRKGVMDLFGGPGAATTPAPAVATAPASTLPTITTTAPGVQSDSPTKQPSKLMRDIKRRPSMAPDVDPSRQVENLRSQTGLLSKDKSALEREKKELEHDLDRLLADKMRLQLQKRNLTALIGLIGGQVSSLSQVTAVAAKLETTLGSERFGKFVKLCAASPPSSWRRHTANKRRKRSQSCPPR